MLKKTIPCAIAIMAISYTNFAVADVRQESFYKNLKARQYVSLGGDHKSDENSKEHELSMGYRYKNNRYIHEIELGYEAMWASTTKKPTRKTKELYEAEISSKILIMNSNNYFNFYHSSQYDQFSSVYYDVTNAVGVGRMLLSNQIEADVNIGYNHTRFGNSEIVLNPTLKVRYQITKNIKLSSKGYIFKRETDYDEKLDSRLSFRFNEKIVLEFIHKYKKDRYYYKKYSTTKTDVDRTYSVRIRYNFW